MRRDADHTFDLKGTIELDTVTVKGLSAHWLESGNEKYILDDNDHIVMVSRKILQ